MPLEDVDVMVLVDVQGEDVGGVTLKQCDKQGIRGILSQIEGRFKLLKEKRDVSHEKQVASGRYVAVTQLPACLSRLAGLPAARLRLLQPRSARRLFRHGRTLLRLLPPDQP